MYCPECELRVADDYVTVCPVCQGPLQSETINGEMPGIPVDKGGSSVVAESGSSETRVSEGRIDDKFSDYKNPEHDFDFNPEEFGLQTSAQEDPAAEEEDIRVLADIWKDEDIDADLEGVMAEAFVLDEADKDIGIEVPNLGKDDRKPVQSEVIPASPAAPAAVSQQKKRRPLLLLLLLVVIGIGGGSWFYSQNFGAKPESRGVKPIPSPQVVKPVSSPPVKKQLIAEKIKKTEPAPEVAPKTPEVSITTAPVSDSAAPKDSPLNALKEKVTLPSQETSVESVAAAVSRSSAEGQEKLSAQKAEVLDKPADGLVEKTDQPALLLESAGEKTSVHKVELAQNDPKGVVKTKPLEDAVKTVTSKTKEPLVLPYAVHIGSFRNKEGASRQLAMLQKKGFAAYQVEVDLKEKGVWQRVLVPGGVTLKEAKVVQQKLADIFPKEDSLIRKIRR